MVFQSATAQDSRPALVLGYNPQLHTSYQGRGRYSQPSSPKGSCNKAERYTPVRWVDNLGLFLNALDTE